MEKSPILLLIKPLIGILIIYTGKYNSTQIKKIGLIISLLNLKHTLTILHLFDTNITGFQFRLSFGGLDGISLILILLVNIIIPITILGGKGDRNYIGLILKVNFWSNAVFYVLDLLLFYVSFEAVLIPMYFLIGNYGSRNKKIEEAKNRLVIYTLIGSLFLLLAILLIYIETGTTNYEILLTLPISFNFQILLFLFFFIAFAIKTPIWPLHIWLPIAHGESSTGTSVILAAILLKFGTYGLIRYTLPLFPLACKYYLPLILCLAIISIIYSCIAALSLIDLKQIIAYSSIAHMNVGIIGIFSNDLKGISGAYIYSISHGLISGGLFLLIGKIYERYHSRIIKYYRGLIILMPLWTKGLFIFSLSNISFPLSLGFIAEILILISTLNISPILTLLISLVSILLPFYFILTLQKISYGKISNYLPILYQDLNILEFHQLFPLIFLTILLGIFPSILFSFILFPIFNLLS